MSNEFYSIVTDFAIQKQMNCLNNGIEFDLYEIALGDGGGDYYEPNSTQTQLKREVWRGVISTCEWEEDKFYCMVNVPAEVGGFCIREAGVFDNSGNLIAIAKFPETYKQSPDSGTVKQLTIRIEVHFLNTEVAALVINPNIKLVTVEKLEAIKLQINDNYQKISEKSQANGYCPLNNNKKVPKEYLPDEASFLQVNCLNSGNVNIEGQADLITNNENVLSFKVSDGLNSNYKPIVGTMANGKQLIRTQIPNYTLNLNITTRVFSRPNLTTYGTPLVDDLAIIKPNDEYSTFYAWRMFDGSNTTQGTFTPAHFTDTSHEFVFVTKNKIKISELSIYNYANGYNNYTIGAYEIYASNNNFSWIELTNGTNSVGASGSSWTITIPENNQGFYNYYKIKALSSLGGTAYPSIGELQLNALEEIIEVESGNIFVGEMGPVLIIQNNISEQAHPPFENLLLNDVWIDTSIAPYSSKKWNGTLWEDFNYIHFATVEKSIVTTLPYNPSKTTIKSYMPDYDNGINKASNTPHQALVNGWVFVLGGSALGVNQNVCEIKISNSENGQYTQIANTYKGGDVSMNNTLFVPIPQGKWFKTYTGNAVGDEFTVFYPNIGE